MKKILIAALLVLGLGVKAHALTGPYVQITTSTLQPGTTRGYWVSSGTAVDFNFVTAKTTGTFFLNGATVSWSQAVSTGTRIDKTTTTYQGAGINGTKTDNSTTTYTGGNTFSNPSISSMTLNTDILRGTTNANTLTLPNQVISPGNLVATTSSSTVTGQWNVKVGSNGASNVTNYSQLQILQTIVFATIATSSATSATTFVPSNLTASITPTSASSRILILVNGTLTANSTTVSRAGFGTIARGSSDLSSGSLGFCSASTLVTSATADNDYPCSMIDVDSPSTTSATTYTVYIRTSNSADSTVWNRGGRISTMTLMEIR